jgi:Spy/CpxP family protein refolding chaperone
MSEATPRQKAALWVGLVFLLGAALGGMLGYVFAHRSYAALTPAQSEQAKKQQKVDRLTQELSLSNDQRQQLDVIITDVQAQYKAIRKSTDPQMAEARQAGRERIRAILTPEQKPKFEAFLQKIDEERKKNESQ